MTARNTLLAVVVVCALVAGRADTDGYSIVCDGDSDSASGDHLAFPTGLCPINDTWDRPIMSLAGMIGQ